MQPRIKNPAMLLPHAMQTMQALSSVVEKSGDPRPGPFACQPGERLQRLCRSGLASAQKDWRNGRADFYGVCVA